MKKPLIMVVEDEQLIMESVIAYLHSQGYETLSATDGNQAWEIFRNNSCDLVILDLMLPGISGEELCQMIRKVSRVPLIMLTAKALEDDKITGLKIGADDYVTKPFSPRELMARVQSLLRRSSMLSVTQQSSWLKGYLRIDFAGRSVYRKQELISLTNLEFKLLATLVNHPNQVFTRSQLIEQAFGDEYFGYERTVDSHIKNLRMKLEEDSSQPQLIATVFGVGYKCPIEPDVVYQEVYHEA